MQDQFGNAVSVAAEAALRHYDSAVDAHLRAWPGVLDSLAAALDESPDFALAHAARALVLAGRGQAAPAREALSQAKASAVHSTPRERSHVDLVGAVVAGRTHDALAAVIEHARTYPNDLLSASTALGAYGLYAFSGRADHEAARLAFTEMLAPDLRDEHPWLIAYRGWARIEAGRVDEGLAMAQRAIALQPRSGHTAHIVLHGFFEQDAPAAALEFAVDWLPRYPDDALMWGHLNWHSALAEIALGQREAALGRLLGPIVEYLPRGTPFMGLADIVSLPWRLGIAGVGGLPWAHAHAHAERHFPEGSNVFGELHLAMLAAMRSDRDALAAVARRAEAIGQRGHEGSAVLVHWTRGLMGLLDGDESSAREHLNACAQGAVRLGGSRAQRDIVEQTRRALRIPS